MHMRLSARLSMILATLALFVHWSGVPARAQSIIETYRTPEEAVAAGMKRDLANAFANLRAAQVSRGSFEATLQQARGEFYSACARGIHDRQAEQQFVEALRAKDFYYAAFYGSSNSQATQQALRMDALIGNDRKIDGGIPPSAMFSFTVFARAYMSLLLNPSMDDQARTERTEDVVALYSRYVFYRDEYERQHWVENRKVVAGPAADTPEQMADIFVKMLGQAAEDKYGDKPDQLASFKPWLDNIHAEIVKFENATPTAEVIAQDLEKNKYPSDIVQTFIDRVKAANSNGKTNQYVLEHELVKAHNELDRRGGHPHPWEPNWEYLRTSLQSLASGRADVHIKDLVFSPPQPLPFQTYNSARADIVHGTWTFPAKPPMPGTDWCTGKPISETPTSTNRTPPPPSP